MDFYKNVLNIELNEYTDLDAGSMSRGLVYERKAGRFEETKTPEDGDVIAFFVRGRLFHVGVFWRGKILHTSQQKNCRYEKLPETTLNERRFYHYVNR